MVSRSTFLGLSLLAVMGAGCGEAALTQITVGVLADEVVEDETRGLRLVIERDSGEVVGAFLLTRDELEFPITMAIVPKDGTTGITASVHAFDTRTPEEDDEPLATATRSLDFIAGRTLFLPLELNRSCDEDECGGRESCSFGGCVDIDFDDALDYTPGFEDGFVTDGGTTADADEDGGTDEDTGTDEDAGSDEDAGTDEDAGNEDAAADSDVDGGTEEDASADAEPDASVDADAGDPGSCESDSDCGGELPACDTSANLCVECLGRADCEGGELQACDTDTNRCMECVDNTDCTDASAPLCDMASNTCGQCSVDADCGAEGEATCEEGACWDLCPDQYELTAPLSSVDDYFGFSVAASEHYLVVGAPLRDSTETTRRGVYVYYRPTPTHCFILDETLRTTGLRERFGHRVALHESAEGPNIVVKSAGVPTVPTTVRLYTAEAWPTATMLEPPDDNTRQYGSALAINGSFIAIGDPDEVGTVGGVRWTGFVRVYRRDGSGGRDVNFPYNGSGNFDQFGTGVLLSGSMLYVGADRARASGTNPEGAVFRFDLSTPDAEPLLVRADTDFREMGQGLGLLQAEAGLRVLASGHDDIWMLDAALSPLEVINTGFDVNTPSFNHHHLSVVGTHLVYATIDGNRHVVLSREWRDATSDFSAPRTLVDFESRDGTTRDVAETTAVRVTASEYDDVIGFPQGRFRPIEEDDVERGTPNRGVVLIIPRGE